MSRKDRIVAVIIAVLNILFFGFFIVKIFGDVLFRKAVKDIIIGYSAPFLILIIVVFSISLIRELFKSRNNIIKFLGIIFSLISSVFVFNYLKINSLEMGYVKFHSIGSIIILLFTSSFILSKQIISYYREEVFFGIESINFYKIKYIIFLGLWLIFGRSTFNRVILGFTDPKIISERLYLENSTKLRIGAKCFDGWSSNSTGAGTCSHHGGVANWEYEVIHNKSRANCYSEALKISWIE